MKKHVFANPVVLQTMLELRRQGWPLKELGFLFGVNHTTIRKKCLRHNIPATVPIYPRAKVYFRFIVMIDGERINPGSSYEDYLNKDPFAKKLFESGKSLWKSKAT